MERMRLMNSLKCPKGRIPSKVSLYLELQLPNWPFLNFLKDSTNLKLSVRL